MSLFLLNTIQNPIFLSGIGCGIIIGWLLRRFMTGESRKENVENIKVNYSVPEEVSGFDEGEYKMILVVRSDLKMGKGKAAAQCAHAAVDAVRRSMNVSPGVLASWRDCGQPKIVVKTDSEDELKRLANEARRQGLVVSIITDAGRTQVAPNTKTVLAVGPGLAEDIDRVTGHLRLY